MIANPLSELKSAQLESLRDLLCFCAPAPGAQWLAGSLMSPASCTGVAFLGNMWAC